MSAGRPRFQWQLDWKSLLAALLFLPVLAGLGTWQLQRAEEKAGMLRSYEARRQLPAVAVTQLESYPNYRPVTARGRFDAKHYWLLDNRIQQGRFGYEVVALFELAEGRKLLVNRGWIAADPSRRTLPPVTFPEGMVTLQGELYYSAEQPFSLGEVAAKQWPRRQQWLDLGEATEAFPALLPTVLQLHAHSPAALRVNRIVVNVTPQKHTAYAVQWFAMALVLAIIFLCRNSNILSVLKRSPTLQGKTENE